MGTYIFDFDLPATRSAKRIAARPYRLALREMTPKSWQEAQALCPDEPGTASGQPAKPLPPE